MRLYRKYFPGNYEELKTYYPSFYSDVFEMDEILKAHGKIADDLEDAIELIYNNNFIEFADEQIIAELEAFIGIELNKQRSIEERRRLVKSFFVGFGRVSASMLEEMIKSYTGADVTTTFEKGDDAGDHYLNIKLDRGDITNLYVSDIIFLLEKKIPAHIRWRATVAYRHSVAIGMRRNNYKFGYELCGTKPGVEVIGGGHARSIVIGVIFSYQIL